MYKLRAHRVQHAVALADIGVELCAEALLVVMQAVIGILRHGIALDAAEVEVTVAALERVALHLPLDQLIRKIGLIGAVGAGIHMPHAVAKLGRDARGDDDAVLLRKVQLDRKSVV